VTDALGRVAAGGLGAAGLEWCLLAVNEKAVDVLLVEDDQRRPGRVCDSCGFLGALETECPVDGSPTRETTDILDEMESAVLGASGRVENVRPGTDLEKYSVAAILRFPVPTPSEAVRGRS
jgi:peptide chain release factor subunit 1